MELAIFILSFFLAVPSVTMAIDSHRNANWQKAQGLAYICSQAYIPPEYTEKCKPYLPPKEEDRIKLDFFLEQNKAETINNSAQ